MQQTLRLKSRFADAKGKRKTCPFLFNAGILIRIAAAHHNPHIGRGADGYLIRSGRGVLRNGEGNPHAAVLTRHGADFCLRQRTEQIREKPRLMGKIVRIVRRPLVAREIRGNKFDGKKLRRGRRSLYGNGKALHETAASLPARVAVHKLNSSACSPPRRERTGGKRLRFFCRKNLLERGCEKPFHIWHRQLLLSAAVFTGGLLQERAARSFFHRRTLSFSSLYMKFCACTEVFSNEK